MKPDKIVSGFDIVTPTLGTLDHTDYMELKWKPYRRRPVQVHAIRMNEPFHVMRGGRVVGVGGDAGDFLICDEYGHLLVMNKKQFEQQYYQDKSHKEVKDE